VPAGHADDAPGEDQPDADVGSGPARWDHPIRLDDIDRLLEGSSDVEHLDAGALRTWRGDLTLVLESLSYARTILAGDVAILRRAVATGTTPVVDDLPETLGSDQTEDHWSEPGDEAADAAITEDFFSRTDELLSAHREMAEVELSSAFDVSGSLAVIDEHLAALTERQEAVEARLGQIRAAVIRHYEEAEAAAREQPA
jgi:hypothetical protein